MQMGIQINKCKFFYDTLLTYLQRIMSSFLKLFKSASRSISAALIVHLEAILKGANSWNLNATIKNAININNGVIVKEGILDFQNRNKEYPHALK
jgi:hypothetical protein